MFLFYVYNCLIVACFAIVRSKEEHMNMQTNVHILFFCSKRVHLMWKNSDSPSLLPTNSHPT